MILYGYYRSSAAYRVRIALNLKGLGVEHRFQHLRKGEQRAPDYLALNPQGLVPTLIDGEARIGQSLAILEYLEERHPDPPLLPADAAGRARVRQLSDAIACDIHPIQNLKVLVHLSEAFGADDGQRAAWARHWIDHGFGAVEALLAASPDTGAFCHGDTPGHADACLVPQVYNARRFSVDLAAYPNIQRIDETCRALPAFADAAPEAQADAE